MKPQPQQEQDRPRKLQRTSQACDLCHRRSIKCRPSEEVGASQCQNCYDFDVQCTYDRPSKRRKHASAPSAPNQGIPSRTNSNAASASAPHTASGSASFPSPYEQRLGPAQSYLDHGVHDAQQKPVPPYPENDHYPFQTQDQADCIAMAWSAFVSSCEPDIHELLSVYMTVIYPIYPVFNDTDLKRRMKHKEYLRNRGFFAAIMAACALVSARIDDGAIPSMHVAKLTRPKPSTDVFFAAACDAIAKDLNKCTGLDFMTACTLLAVTCIQRGELSGMQQHLGTFFTLVSMQRFYDERFWPNSMTSNEVELCRRVYWCTYALDIYVSAVWNCFLRSQENRTNIRYPTELESDVGQADSFPSHDHVLPSWITGWHFFIDLHRFMEHALIRLRSKQGQHRDRLGVSNLMIRDNLSDHEIMQTIMQMYHKLPQVFKETPPMTGDPNKDVYGYQAANIQAILQLLRMILLALSNDVATDRKCDVVGEVLRVFHSIPMDYLRAISTPLIYHLGTIAQILAGLMHQPLTDDAYRRLRALLLSMADLLDALSKQLVRIDSPSQVLRRQVSELDTRISTQARAPGPSTTITAQGPFYVPVGDYHPEDGNDSHVHTSTDAHRAEFSFPPELFGRWTWPASYEPVIEPYTLHGQSDS